MRIAVDICCDHCGKKCTTALDIDIKDEVHRAFLCNECLDKLCDILIKTLKEFRTKKGGAK